MAEPVTLEAAAAGKAEVFAHLYQLYMHDFSEITDLTGEIGEDGRFALDKPLARFWQEPRHEALLIRREGHIAGFALLNAVPHSCDPVDFNMAEFFILRRHRRSGTGTLAACAIFRQRPGQWELAVLRSNRAALSFWRQAIGGEPAAHGIDERDVDDARWDGALFRFAIA